ncbi:MAG: hypothetical protein UU14_C0021G0014 [Candidatus Roizmanbacteria bacterium GW2011_GWB1_40_7]|uniref:Uncharacterized protein n=1 Tax=Candidatus Roizmanbacteria bacterium GW2011_GWB1_40_7 TaxID=1618482 RepID=A0A0G0TA90_9BACT|nr:MAG: hypothetical protein UU14_C0021G0014 [Candidatus Roizmanbacteria bacterium GW2011_GWB1_40_7]
MKRIELQILFDKDSGGGSGDKAVKETFFGIPLDIWVKLDPVDRKLMAGVNCTQNPWEFDSEVVHEIITLGTSSIDPELLTPYILNKVEVARSQKSE